MDVYVKFVEVALILICDSTQTFLDIFKQILVKLDLLQYFVLT